MGILQVSRLKSLFIRSQKKMGLGIHLTLDLNGRVRFGPNTELIDNVSYSVSERAKPNFVNAIKSYWRDLDPQKLYPDYSGIRPKVVLNGNISDDFIIETHLDHVNLGLINLLGIEPPCLMACLAIADEVVAHFI